MPLSSVTVFYFTALVGFLSFEFQVILRDEVVRVLQPVYSHLRSRVGCGWTTCTKVLGSLVGGARGGGAKGLPIPAFRGLLPAELTSRGRYWRHSAVAAGGCRPALWSRRNSRVAPLILTVPCFKTWLEIVCDAFSDHLQTQHQRLLCDWVQIKVLSRLTSLDLLHQVFFDPTSSL